MKTATGQTSFAGYPPSAPSEAQSGAVPCVSSRSVRVASNDLLLLPQPLSGPSGFSLEGSTGGRGGGEAAIDVDGDGDGDEEVDVDADGEAAVDGAVLTTRGAAAPVCAGGGAWAGGAVVLQATPASVPVRKRKS